MNLFPFGSPQAKSISEETVALAAQLRRLACELERGEISTVIATVIRADGEKERIGTMPGMVQKS